VVESPSKAKKITEMLSSEYVVQASGGHIRDLPIKPGENGYDSSTLEPIYVLTDSGKKSASFLKKRKSECTEILLATDPDREGEAIAWHVAEVMGIKKRSRVKFHEITETAIKKAINNPTPLDVNLVRAQEARRVIDRIVGWSVSLPLSRIIGEKASAGRVQSPSLGLIVEREREINTFVPHEYFGARLLIEDAWVVNWVVGKSGEQCLDKTKAEFAANVKDLVVIEFEEKEDQIAPPSPFDTASLLQAASVKLYFDPDKTMEIAQTLFQGLEGNGHGFITYHRTDETNISDDAFLMIKDYASKNGLVTVQCKRTWPKKNGAQEAHEAIRPTDFNTNIDALNEDQKALYNLIHKRCITSQLCNAVYSVRTASIQGSGLIFKATGKVVINSGWKSYSGIDETETDDQDMSDTEESELIRNKVPFLTIGQNLKATKGKILEKWTKQPSRYTKASLIKKLESLGIGRPATYSVAVDGLEKRGYATIVKRYLTPTPLAEKIYDALKGNFSFIEVGYTKELEKDLDLIAEGKKNFTTVVRNMHSGLMTELLTIGGPVKIQPARLEAKTDDGDKIKCPKCKKTMHLRTGAKGNFYGCSGYPKCKGTLPIPNQSA
jgi:DNA topoisomerase-1